MFLAVKHRWSFTISWSWHHLSMYLNVFVLLYWYEVNFIDVLMAHTLAGWSYVRFHSKAFFTHTRKHTHGAHFLLNDWNWWAVSDCSCLCWGLNLWRCIYHMWFTGMYTPMCFHTHTHKQTYTHSHTLAFSSRCPWWMMKGLSKELMALTQG